MNATKPLIIIPTYNEADNIKKLIEEINKLTIKFYILIVDGHSFDGTPKIVGNLNNFNKSIFLINQTKKNGLGGAYKEGLAWAIKRDFSHIISMDADFSHDPNYIPVLLKKCLGGYDIVIGSRYIEGGKIVGWKWHQYLNSKIANIVSRFLLGLNPKDVTAGFKCYSRNFITSLNLNKLVSSGYAFQVEMIFLAQVGNFKIAEIPITFSDRKFGKSKISGEIINSSKSIFMLSLRRTTIKQFIKFAIVGVINTAIDWLVYWAIISLFSVSAQNLKQIAKAFSFIVSATGSFIMNRKWTFESTNKKIYIEASKFFIISIFGLFANNVIFYFVTAKLKFSDIIGLIFATALIMFWNFFANKYWTFKNVGDNL